ncbi:MAG TPA: protein kinase [Pedococcus sp.]|nr:protein kinase [Pedococcus sp.]
MMIAEGVLLNERYRLDELIATGGMGQVWRATDQLLGRLVAVKVVQGGGADGGTAGESDFRARFRDEARNSAALSHPNIATVYDFGGDAEHPYLVMEQVEGQSLAQVVAERGALPPEEVRSIIAQAALALQVAHTAGVVHRDVKPANIMLTPAGLVKLTDFGIARVAAGSGLTRTGEVLGTPHYLSPEQAQGEAATAASDIYALGVVGHELLTGRRPFQGESLVATALAHVNQPAPELPESVPQPLRGALMAALAKDPAHRPPTAGELATMVGMPLGPLTPIRGLEGLGTPASASASAPSTEKLPEPSSVPSSAPTRTTVLPLPPRVGPTGGGAGETSRRRKFWWLLPAGGLLTLLAIVLAVSLSGGGNKPPTGAATTPVSHAGSAATAPPTTRSTPSTTSAPTRSPSPTVRPSTPAHRSPQPASAPHGGKGKGKGGKKK